MTRLLLNDDTIDPCRINERHGETASALRSGRHVSPSGVALVTLHGSTLISRLREIGYGLLPGSAEAGIAEFEVG